MTIKTLEIECLDIDIVMYRGKDLFETQLYAQDNGLVVLNSPEINAIARSLENETPDPEWVKQQAEKLGLKRKQIEHAYASFHDDVRENYWIRAGEILAWPPYSERIVNSDLNRKSEKPILLRGYEISERSKGDYIIEGGEVIEVDWPRENGTIPENLAQLLNAKDNTYVWTNPNPKQYEGLRALDWDFRLREGPGLDSVWVPWLSGSGGGSLLGRSADEDFTKVPTTIYQKMLEFGDKITSLSEEWQRLLSELHE